jgi:hypothetical protein
MTDKNKIEEFKFKTTSAMISRKKREVDSDDDYMIGIIRLFDVNNPHKTKKMPTRVLEYKNIEKIRIRNLNVSYYLEGNDIIINDIIELYVLVNHTKHKIVLRAYQKAVEERKEESVQEL